MSIASIAAYGPARIVNANAVKVYTLDIERFPGAFRIENWRGLTVEGEFWDLGQYRRTFHRRIHPDEVTRWPRTICAAWRRYGTKRVEFRAEWDEGGREQMLRDMWAVYDDADVVVGHNVDAFDTKTLKGEWWLMDMPWPRPFKSVDTLKVARQEMRLESNTLDSLVKRKGHSGKDGKYDVELARRALDGHIPSQKEMRRYNVGDIDASEFLYDEFRGKMPGHPHLGEHGDAKVCNQCGSQDLVLDHERKAQDTVLFKALYRCANCGANVKAGWVARAASTRGAR